MTKFFHWSIAALFGVQLVTIVAVRALMAEGLAGTTTLTWSLLDLHKASGLLILFLGLPRLAWRKISPLPEWPSSFGDWDKSLTHFAEYGLYTCIFVMCLSGLLIELAGGHYIPFFGLFYLDNLAPYVHAGAFAHMPEDDAARAAGMVPVLRDVMVAVHVLGAFTVLICLSAHVTHVVRHRTATPGGILRRMLPGASEHGLGKTDTPDT
jgi:cytochrome b561